MGISEQSLAQELFNELEQLGFVLEFENDKGEVVHPTKDSWNAFIKVLCEFLRTKVTVKLSATATVTSFGTPAPVVGTGELVVL